MVTLAFPVYYPVGWNCQIHVMPVTLPQRVSQILTQTI